MLLKFPGKFRKRHGRASAASGVVTIPQSDAGAEQPAAPSASCITTKVSAGNFTKPFQLKAAPYLRPVNEATEATPPKASITSAVVDSSRSGAVMESLSNPSYLDTQYPNLIDTKKFGFAPSCPPMAYAGGDDNEDVALRCRALTLIYAKDETDPTKGVSSKFAEEIDITPTRWNGIEGSGALSRDVARKITRKWPEVSLDWLYRGRDEAYTRTRSEEFLAAYKAVVAKAKADQAAEKAKKPKRRAS